MPPMKLSTPELVTLSRLLDEALPLGPAERRAWLESLSIEFQPLLPALRAALSTDTPDHNIFLTLPKIGSAVTLSPTTGSSLQPGARIGPYELIRTLGVGGMAEVWLARRADGAFQREVALKLPLLTRLREDLKQRFARERDILASLEHPNIARLYDAGVDTEGLPYLAMEYVPGQPLTAWCDERKLSIAARLRLFLYVAEAVQYAHEKQVIHRDLKPSNIMVSESGQVRLLDFGVAKLLEAAEGARADLTSVYGRAITPDYASPEALKGDPIDARSDIYSLGVLLYELLTGSRPYRLKSSASTGLMAQAIATAEVKKPSTQLEQEFCSARATTPERLARELRGDLDVIALKALAKEPAERYSSAAAMAQDLRRHLENRPIQARPAPLTYRLRKFAARNRPLVIVSAVASTAVVALVGYEIESRLAVPSITISPVASISGQSIAVLPFADMSEKKDQEYFTDGLAEELIELLGKTPGLHVIARTSSFSFKGKADDISTIATKLKVANILEGSVRKFDTHLRISTQLVRAADGEHLWSQTYDRDLKDVFRVQDEIAQSVASALKLTLSPDQASSPSRSLNTSAHLQYLNGQYYLSRANSDDFRRSVAAYRSATALDPNYAAAYAGLAIAEGWLAEITGDNAELERASAAAQRAVELAPDQALGYAARGLLRGFHWEWAGAQADLVRAVEFNPNESTVLQYYATQLGVAGRLPEAIAISRRAVDLDPLSVRAWYVLAIWLLANRDLEAARETNQHALAIDPANEFALTLLGTVELLERKPAVALAIFHRISGDSPNQLGFRLLGIAMAEHSLGHARESTQALDEASAKTGQAMAYQIAEAHAWCGDVDKAFEWLDRAYRQWDSGLSQMNTDPLVDALHGDPRYKAMLRKINLPG